MSDFRMYRIATPKCGYHDNCDTCPLEECLQGEGVRRKTGSIERQREEAGRLLKEGKGVKEIALALGVRQRTAYRYMRAKREKEEVYHG